MEDGDTEKYPPSRVIQDIVYLSPKRGCINCISLQVYNKNWYQILARTVVKKEKKISLLLFPFCKNFRSAGWKTNEFKNTGLVKLF